MHEAEVWEALARWRAAGRRFVLATVVETRGFTPRKPAAHMLIAAGGETSGTVGGGAIEHEVMEHAATLLARGGHAVLKRHLTQELGMCCGGEMTLFLEVLSPAPRFYLFGAGYIAKPLAAIAAGCGFAVTVVDPRPEWASIERFPTSTVLVQETEDFARMLETTSDDYAAIVTHDHAIDQRLVQVLLRKPLRFLGMIGSVPKQRKFALRLRARGFSDEEIARLHTPLGLEIGAATPEEIAVSAMAQIIARRRGATIAPGWVPPPARGAPGDQVPASEAAAPGAAREGREVPAPRLDSSSAEMEGARMATVVARQELEAAGAGPAAPRRADGASGAREVRR